MEKEEFYELHARCLFDPIEDDSIMFRKVITVKGITYQDWGWNKCLDIIKRHFLYAFLIKVLYDLNQVNGVIINDVLLDYLFDSLDYSNLKLTDKDETFAKMFELVLDTKGFDDFKEEARVICDYLISLGYELDYTVFKTPLDAKDTIIKVDEELGDEATGLSAIFDDDLE